MNTPDKHNTVSDCPAPAELGAFLRGKSSSADARKLRRHLGHCPHCSREASLMRQRLEARQETLSFSQWLRILAGRLQTGLASAPTFGFRGVEDAVQIYDLEEGLALIIDVVPDPERPSRYQLDGLLPALEADRVRATLWQEAAPVVDTQLDATGGFSLPSVPAGDYELVVQGEGLIVHVHSLIVGN